ncbi:aldo/keto reductase [Sphingomonas psychrotolerans]|uniref:aldo/keto reductase n=1 Tax=Sphingomonas psychrotolerans TaxID=1327635 RepID=UPI00130516EE|nr:aldo/keto reductase [Sphingomonas psychrotolerans]
MAVELAGAQRLALGTMGLAGVYGPVPSDIAQQTIRAALDVGITLFDTAPLYGNGIAERLLGAELAGQDAAVVTKFGLAAGRDGMLFRDSRPASVRRSVETSLRRLRRDRIDILLQHRPDPAVGEEEVAGMLQRLVEEGKAAQVGLSGSSLTRAVAMGAMAPIRVVQNEFSAASEILPRETPADFSAAGLMLMAHSPLARGLLARTQPRLFPVGDHRATMRSLDQAGQIALLARAALRFSDFATLSDPRVAIRWVLDQGAAVVAVIGARSPAQVRGLMHE